MEALGREGEGRPLLELVADKKPGKKDGQVLMIKNNGVVEAYQVGFTRQHLFLRLINPFI